MNASVRPDADYARADHAFREADPYAKAKYDLTLRWLCDAVGADTLLYNVGCGGGYFNYLAAARGARVEACEPDPVAYAAAAARNDARVSHCGLEEFARERAPADVLVMHDVLEHIEDDRTAVRTAARLLRPGGIAAISVPALPALFGLHDEQLGHYRRYDAVGLRRLLGSSFRIERLQWYGMFSIPLVLWFSRWQRKAYPVRAGSSGAVGKCYAALCALESRVPEPIGTSLVALVRPV